jgi:hypothetical protein
MDTNEKLYIECLATAVKKLGFIEEPGKDVFLGYFNIAGEKQQIIQTVKKEYEGVTQESFQKKINLDDLIEKNSEMINSFKNIVNRLNIENSYEIRFNDYSTTEFRLLFNFYCRKTGQVRDKPAEIYHFKKNSLLSLQTAIEKIAEKVLEISLLEDIGDQLCFQERYNPEDKIIKKRVADACWEIFEILDNKGKIVKGEQILKTVLIDYHIEKYEDLPKKEAKGKIRAAAKQWVRDHKKNLQIK